MSRHPKSDRRDDAPLFADHRARSMALYDALPPLTRAALRDVEHPCVYTAWDMVTLFGDAIAALRLAPGAPALTAMEREGIRQFRASGEAWSDGEDFVRHHVDPPAQASLF